MTDIFPIVPANTRALWMLVGFVSVVLVAVMVMLVATTRGARNSRFELSSEGLRLRGDLYGRLIAPSAIRSEGVRVVDLATSPELVPVARTAGTSVGGYNAGWFRLRNGEKALLYLTDRRRVVYVPTTIGYSLLLSAQEPDRMAERLRGNLAGL